MYGRSSIRLRIWRKLYHLKFCSSANPEPRPGFRWPTIFGVVDLEVAIRLVDLAMYGRQLTWLFNSCANRQDRVNARWILPSDWITRDYVYLIWPFSSFLFIFRWNYCGTSSHSCLDSKLSNFLKNLQDDWFLSETSGKLQVILDRKLDETLDDAMSPWLARDIAIKMRPILQGSSTARDHGRYRRDVRRPPTQERGFS